jgi:hypothetical protein
MSRAALSTLMAMVVAVNALNAQGLEFKGVVLDSATNQPINGAIVDLANANRRFSARTDEAGAFHFASIDPASYRVGIRRIGYAPVSRDLDVFEGVKRHDFTMAPIPQALRQVNVRGEGAGIFGQIGHASTFKPVPNARVEVAGADRKVVTDSSGSFFVPLKKAGTYVVRVVTPGFADDMFIVTVRKDQVADGSRLLSDEDGRHHPEILWKEFDQRLRWSTVNGAALLTGSEIRSAGTTIRGALESSGSLVAKSLRLGSTVCVFINGRPAPGYGIDAIRPEEVTAIEAYGPRGESATFLNQSWPRGGAPCSETGVRSNPGPHRVAWLVIWTR